MHHFGGGYSDIKFTYKSWVGTFVALKNDPEALVLGFPFDVPGEFRLSKKYAGTTELENY